jgi:hypothetical protein
MIKLRKDAINYDNIIQPSISLINKIIVENVHFIHLKTFRQINQ